MAMMTRSEAWSHPICDQCWFARHPKVEPARRTNGDLGRERCCFCSQPTKSGAYESEDPWELPRHTPHSLARNGNGS